jgi:hypothetical protein
VKTRGWRWLPLLLAVVLFGAAAAGVTAYVMSGRQSSSTGTTQRNRPIADSVLDRLQAECNLAGGHQVNISGPFLDGSAAGVSACAFDNSDGSFSRPSRPGIVYQEPPCDGPAAFYVIVDANLLDWAEPLPVRHAPLPGRLVGCA